MAIKHIATKLLFKFILFVPTLFFFKDYELQLMTYRAMVDSQHKSPVKRRKMQSSSDVIQQEVRDKYYLFSQAYTAILLRLYEYVCLCFPPQFMDLRTRYTALVTLMTQYVKFAGETLKRAEEDEVGHLLTCYCLSCFIKQSRLASAPQLKC